MEHEVLYRPSYSLLRIRLERGESVSAEAGAMVSMSSGIEMQTAAKGGLKSTLFSGEGLVCELTGPGKIMIQSRSADAFLSWLIPQIPKDNRR